MRKPRAKSAKNVAKMIGTKAKPMKGSFGPAKPKSQTIGSMYPLGKEHGSNPRGQMGAKSVYHNPPKKRKK